MRTRICLAVAAVLLLVGLAAPNAVSSSVTLDQANAAHKRAYDLGEPDVEVIKAKLTAGKYGEIEKEYAELLDLYFENVDYGWRFEEAYDLFHPDNGVSMKWLDAWVEATGSYMAYGARGTLKMRLGHEARGGAVASKTSREQFEAMDEFFVSALMDLVEALKMEPRCMPLYSIVINIGTVSNLLNPDDIIEVALTIDNRNFQVREDYLRSLQPRWGGSYQDMAEFAEASQAFADLNPRILTLKAAMSEDRAWYLQWDHDYEGAVARYTDALRFGDDIGVLHERARCYVELEELDKALADYERILYYRPNDEKALHWKAGLE